VIVRSAEQVSRGQIRRAEKTRVSNVTFIFPVRTGVIEKYPGDDPCFRAVHALADSAVPGSPRTKLVETLGITLGLDGQAYPVHARPELARRIFWAPKCSTRAVPASARFPLHSFNLRSGVRAAVDADEINRASPRTQSALLQAMQEQHINGRRCAS